MIETYDVDSRIGQTPAGLECWTIQETVCPTDETSLHVDVDPPWAQTAGVLGRTGPW